MNLFQILAMAEDFNITNIYCAYFDNEPHYYTSDDLSLIYIKDDVGRYEVTGWHVCPNLLWSHVCTPKQWAEFMMQYEAYHVKSLKCTLFNPVPITTNIAIQRTNLFAAFNNCTYLWGYEDDLYETSWYQWNTQNVDDRLNLMFKEGVYYKGGMGTMGSASDSTAVGDSNYTWKRYKWPIYAWRRPDHRTPSEESWSQGVAGGDAVFHAFRSNAANTQAMPTGISWDPLNRPDHIKELRAGKNAMSFSWECHPVDEQKWYNLDLLASWVPWTAAGPYCGGHRPRTYKYAYTEDPDQLTTHGLAQSRETASVESQTQVRPWQDYTVPDYSFIPIVPMAWWWKEMQQSIAENVSNFNETNKIDKYFPGTEREQYHYPPNQWFAKGLPLYDAGNSLIRTSTQCAVKITLTLNVKKRRSALYCPTWGPFAGKQLYHGGARDRIFQPAVIKYRTGGMRRTWQNINRWADSSDSQMAVQIRAHPREDPYILPNAIYPNNTNLPPTVTAPATSSASTFKNTTAVAFNKENEQVTFSLPIPSLRRKRDKSPAKMLDESMMEDLQQGP